MNAVVTFSGGQDSTTCLAWALSRFDRVAALSFDYGQRHRVELDCARRIADRMGVEHHVLPVDTLAALAGGALTNPDVEVEAVASGDSAATWAAERGLPSTFIPGRNLLFFTIAAAWGLPRGFDTLVTGICQADRAGYPDCRDEFRMAATDAIRLAMDAPRFRIAAPLVRLSKADTWQLAAELDVLDVIIGETHTCYQGDHETMWAWGLGCGACPACEERERGYVEAFQPR